MLSRSDETAEPALLKNDNVRYDGDEEEDEKTCHRRHGTTRRLLGQDIVAVVIFDEPFNLAQLAAFALVWAGLVLMTVDNLRRGRALRRLERERLRGDA